MWAAPSTRQLNLQYGGLVLQPRRSSSKPLLLPPAGAVQGPSVLSAGGACWLARNRSGSCGSLAGTPSISPSISRAGSKLMEQDSRESSKFSDGNGFEGGGHAWELTRQQMQPQKL